MYGSNLCIFHFNAEFELHVIFILNTVTFLVISTVYCDFIIDKNIEQRVYLEFCIAN
jgi:hypothetical protein